MAVRFGLFGNRKDTLSNILLPEKMYFCVLKYSEADIIFMIYINRIKTSDILKITVIVFSILTFFCNMAFAQRHDKTDTIQYLSPFDFGLAEAETDSARYEVLYATHTKAVETGAEVSYQGIGTLVIEVTEHSLPIPLTRHNDFAGLNLIVKNQYKAQYLFSMVDTLWQSVELSPSAVDSGDFTTNPFLSEGLCMLLLEDAHPWVQKRSGHNYGAIRKDMLLVHNGHAQNSPAAPYSTDSTRLNAWAHRTDEGQKTITDLTITRDSSSTSKTYCFDIKGINNLKISKLRINTPDTKDLYADAAINIESCTNIVLEDVTIEGTYSRTNKYGYGIQMNNVWNSLFLRLTAHANWGIFGTNNLSNTTLRDCDINRFDIHCYGRDVFFFNCKFNKLYNQFSSVFGAVRFEDCRFIEFVPVLFEPSYNAYTPFDITFKNCIFDAQTSRNYLISAGELDNNTNSRPELAKKCWPNIDIQNLTVNIPGNVSKIILFNSKKSAQVAVNYITDIKIDGLHFHYADTTHLADFIISNTPVSAVQSINYKIQKAYLIPSVNKMTIQSTAKGVYPGSMTFNLRRDKNDVVSIDKSRLNYNVNENSQYNINYSNSDIGMIRYNSKNNGVKRNYDRCNLYLNNGDDARYYIDNHATYYKCMFIPCSDKMFVSFYGVTNDVVIKNCKTKRNGKLFYQGHDDNIELKGYVVNGNEKYWR